jgi:hypothetical protein
MRLLGVKMFFFIFPDIKTRAITKVLEMMSGNSLLSLSMSDSFEPAPVSSYLEELQSLPSPINRNGKLGDQRGGSFIAKESRHDAPQEDVKRNSASVDDKVLIEKCRSNPCTDMVVEGNFQSGHQSIVRSQSCPVPQKCAALLDWHSELIVATQTLQAFSMVDRGELDWDD